MRSVHILLLLIVAQISFAQGVDIVNLHPRPKAAFLRSNGAGGFIMSRMVVIVVPDVPSALSDQTVGYLESLLKERVGDTLRVMRASSFGGDLSAILVGEPDVFPRMTAELSSAMPKGESLNHAQGYVLDVNSTRVILAGADPQGTFNGVATLVQLIIDRGPLTLVPALHIWDYPDYPDRWVFSQHNFLGKNVIATMRGIEDTMAFHKLNGINQGDFKYNILDLMRAQIPNYFDSIKAFKSMSALRNIEIVPSVAGIGWSDGILYHDPNLAEGLPTSAHYVIEADTGRLIPIASTVLPNGGFESVNASNGQFTGWSWYDGPNQSVFVDSTVAHSGRYSARCTNFTVGNSSGNCRFQRVVACQPYRYYVLSAWVRTQSFSADNTQFLVAGTSGGAFYPMTFTQLGIPATSNGWQQIQVVFNTLAFDTVAIYAGVWGGKSGTIWWDDIQVRDGGLTNVLRRAGTPMHVRSASGTREFREGVDVVPIVDSVMLAGHGSFGPYHTPPTLRRLPGGSLRNGDTITVSYFHPFTAVSDENGNGSVMACVSDDTLYRILRDQISRVDTLYHAERYFLSHDEIRNMNHDSACLARRVSPAVLLADNLMHCKALVDSIHPGARSLVWSDMFDSLHNAHNSYYLINGDLTGDWRLIDTAITIVNWNGGKAAQSLAWFSKQGFRQITSPYYDVGNTSTIRAWRLAQEGVPNVDGMLYTTWSNDYRFLTAFADYAWSAGPYLMHQPLDSAALPALAGGTPVSFSTVALADPYDGSDKITSVHVIIDGREDTVRYSKDLTMTAQANNAFSASQVIPTRHGFRYHLVATNTQGITRITPTYEVGTYNYTSSAVRETPADPRIALTVAPDPVSTSADIGFMMPQSGAWRVTMTDALGRVVVQRQGHAGPAQYRHETLDVHGLPNGAYRCAVQTAAGVATRAVLVVR